MEEEVSFNCESDHLQSKPAVSDYHFYLGEEDKKRNNQSTWTTTFKSIKDSGHWACKTENDIGVGDQSDQVELVVQGKLY